MKFKNLLPIFIIVPVLLALSACKNNSITPIINSNDSVLFIGNSNVGSEGGLQHHFRRTLAKAEPSLTIGTHWIGMYDRPTLKDMYSEEAIERIKEGNENIIVVQSGSVEAMLQFANLVAESNKQMIVFGAWENNPYLENENWASFKENTQKAMEQLLQFEKEHNIPVAPCGLVYYDLLADPITFDGLRDDYLFVPGGSVQNDLGTMVNVATIYAVATGKSPVGLKLWDPFPQEIVTAVQERVWEIVHDWKKGKIDLKPVPEEMSQDRYKPQMSVEEKWESLLSEGDHIYYVGNSFIGTEGGLENHFPRLLSQVDPALSITTNSDIFWGRGLQSMYTNGVRQKISEGDNDIVVVTSGPVDLLKKFHADITTAGSQMAVHMTWGWNPTINERGIEGFREQTIRIVESMQQFEAETGVPIIPCGLIFYDLVVDPPKIEGADLRLDWVYMVENIHQNHIGTMSNAAAHYAVLTGKSPVGLPMWDPYPSELVTAVQERAWKIVQDWKAGTVDIKPLPEQ